MPLGPQPSKITEEATEIAYESAPTGLADIFSSMLTAFWYATLAQRPLVHWPEKHQYGRHCEEDAVQPAPPPERERDLDFKRTTENFKASLDRRIGGDWPRGRGRSRAIARIRAGSSRATGHALNASGVESSDAILRGLVDKSLAGLMSKRTRRPRAPLWPSSKPRSRRGPVVCVHARTGLVPELRRVDNAKRTRPDDEMHGTRASGISSRRRARRRELRPRRAREPAARRRRRRRGLGFAQGGLRREVPLGKELLADWARNPSGVPGPRPKIACRRSCRRRPRAKGMTSRLREANARTFASGSRRRRGHRSRRTAPAPPNAA